MIEKILMPDSRLIFIHGLEGTSHGVKATLLRGLFPDILTPDFPGSLEQRMEKLRAVIGQTRGWTLIGSSFGGLMAALLACAHPEQVDQLVLLAPALIWPDFAANPPDPVSVPTVVYHGRQDGLIPLETVRRLAEQVFLNLTFHEVDDDHGLYKTVHAIDWPQLLGREANR
jgi:pimeloyl-ACP methyl ester carboxylesterase